MDIEFLNGGVPVQIKSVKVGYYLAAYKGGGGPIILCSAIGLEWEAFRLIRLNENEVSFLALHGQYWGVKDGKRLVAESTTLGECEKFEIVRSCDDPKLIRIKAHNGLFLQVKSQTDVSAECYCVNRWENDDPSVFTMTIMQYKDGATFRLWSPSFKKYLCPENGGGQEIVANRSNASFWEYFMYKTTNEKKVYFKVSNGMFMGLDGENNLVALSNKPGNSEMFAIIRNQYDPDRIRIRAPNGFFLRMKSRMQVSADFGSDNGWQNDDPSVFIATVLHYEKDGFQIQLKGVLVGNYLSAENGGGTSIVANRAVASSWETFDVCSKNEERFSSKVFNGQFMGLESGTNKLIAVSQTSGTSEMFDIVRNPNDSRQIRIKASNGKFLQVKSETLVTADYNEDESWQEDNPSVFNIAIKNYIEGALTANCTLSPTEIEDYDSEDMFLAANLALLAKPSLRTFKSWKVYLRDIRRNCSSLSLLRSQNHPNSLINNDLSFLAFPRNLPASVLLLLLPQLKMEKRKASDELSQIQKRIKVLEDEIAQKTEIVNAQQHELIAGVKKFADTCEAVVDWETVKKSAIARLQDIEKEWSTFTQELKVVRL